jgi:hypothetical protein
METNARALSKAQAHTVFLKKNFAKRIENMSKDNANKEISIKPKLITTSQDSYRLYDAQSLHRSVNTSKA